MNDVTPRLQDDLQNILSWRILPRESNEWAASHQVRCKGNGAERKIVMILKRAKPRGDYSSDFSLNHAALIHLVEAERDGRIERGYIATAELSTSTVFACVPATEVKARIGNTPPNNGDYGKYYWMTETLFLVGHEDDDTV